MPTCLNPECGKEVQEGKTYCNRDCLKRHLELKKSEPHKTEIGAKLASEDDIWFGQERRKRAMETILRLARELCPTSYKGFVCTVSYRTGLSLRKITDDYLVVLLGIGRLKMDGSILVVKEDEKV